MNQNDIAWRSVIEAPVAVGLYELRLKSQKTGELLVVPGEFDGVYWHWIDIDGGPFFPHEWRAMLSDSQCWNKLTLHLKDNNENYTLV